MKKILHSTRGQAALEFLTTYGWMIVITLIVGAALAQFGVFNPEKILPEQCDLGYDFSCKQYIIFENGTVRVEAVNKIGYDIIIKAFECVYEDQSMSSITATNEVWTAGGKTEFECPGSTNLEVETATRIEITLAYQKATGGFTKSITGSVQSKIVESN